MMELYRPSDGGSHVSDGAIDLLGAPAVYFPANRGRQTGGAGDLLCDSGVSLDLASHRAWSITDEARVVLILVLI